MARYEASDPDESIINTISGHIRVGADFMLAAAACGVSEEKALRWLEAINAENCHQSEVYYNLRETVRQAQAHAEVIALQRLSAEGGAAGARWLLEKMNPGKYLGSFKTKPSPGAGGGVSGMQAATVEDLFQ